MAALSKRDIEMIFRAETAKATRNIGDLRKESKNLRGTLDELSAAAAKGDVNLEKLEQATRALKDVQDELGTARSLLTTLNSQNTALDKSTKKLEEARTKYAGLKAQVEAAEQPTKRLVQQYEASERALNRASEAQDRQQKQFAETKAQIEGIIGPVTNFRDSFETIAKTSKDVGRSLAITGEQADQFKGKLADLARQQQQTADTKSFIDSGVNAGLLREQVEYISQFENRVELLSQAKRELSAQDANFAKALQAQEARLGEQNVRNLERAFEDAAQAEQRLEQINAFKKIATDAKASINDVSRFGPALGASAQSAERLADAILHIVEPTRAAVQGIDGIESTILSAANVLEGKGRRSLEQYNDALNDIALSNAALVRLAKDVDAFDIQAQSAARAEQNFRDLRAEAQKLANAFDPASADAERLANELRQAEAAMEAAGREMQQEKAKADKLGQSLLKAGIDTDRLADAQKRLAATARLGADQTLAIQKKVGRKGLGPFGFSLQDTQNLSYQVNDLITQISSGTPVAQAFAQQFGQIYQIPAVNNLIKQFSRLIPVIAAAGIALGVFIAGLNRIEARSKGLKELRATLIEAGKDTGAAEGLYDIVDALDRMGISGEDAAASVKTLTREGLDPKLMEDFVVAAKNVTTFTDALGESVPDATEAMIEGFDGTRDSVLDLDDKFHFLTDSTREQIAAQGDGLISTTLLDEAFGQFYDTAQDVAAQMEGDSVDSSRALENAWDDLLDAVGTSGPWDAIVNYMKNVRVGAALTIRVIAGLVREWGGALATIAKGAFQLATGNFLGAYQTLSSQAGKGAPKGIGTIIDEARAATLKDLGNDPTTRDRSGGGFRAPRQRAQPAKGGGRKTGKSDAQKEAERAAKQIESLQEQLTNSLDQMNAQVAKAAFGSLQTQLDNAANEVDSRFAELFRHLDELDKLSGGKALINGKTIAQYREQLELNKQILTNASQLKVFEENLNDLVRQRADLLAGIEERQQAGGLTAAEAAAAAAEVTSRIDSQIQDLVASGLKFVETIKGAEVSPQVQRLVALLLGKNAEAVGKGSQKGFLTSQLGQQESEINRIVGERNALIAANNTLVELGLKSQRQAQIDAEAAFARTNAALNPVVQQTRDLIESNRTLLTELGVYDLWVAKLQAVEAQAKFVNADALAINQEIQDSLLRGGLDMFNALSQGISNFATGLGSLTDIIGGVARAFAQFAANFLAQIAQMIVKQLLLNAITSAFGVPGGGGIGGFISSIAAKHGGGKVGGGSSQYRRTGLSVSPLAVAAAPRYHNGTQGAGLRPDEQLSVLKRGEKVLTEEQQLQDQRRAAGNKSAGKGLRQVLAFGDEEIAGAMAGPAGEEVTVTHIRRNRGRIRQELGING